MVEAEQAMQAAPAGEAAAPDVVDLVFPLHGRTVPRSCRAPLAAALTAALPWLAATAGAAVHRLNVSAGGGGEALLSHRTRLTLRLPRERLAGAVAALSGARLVVGGHDVALGEGTPRELQPFHTLYAHLVAARSTASAGGPGTAGAAGAADAAGSPFDTVDELALQRELQAEIAARGWPCRAIFGRPARLGASGAHGVPVMLDGLAPEVARAVMCLGLGAHPLLGCGVFVPHKSAAAVGSG